MECSRACHRTEKPVLTVRTNVLRVSHPRSVGLLCRRTAVGRCGVHVAPRARAGRAALGRWPLGDVPQGAQQAVEDGLPGGGARRNELGGGLLHSSCWCARHAFRHCARRTVLSLPRVCAAPPSRAAIVGDLRPHPEWPAASMDARAVAGAGEQSAGARAGASHPERPRALPARRIRCARTACSLRRSLWASQGTSEPCLLHGV